MFLGKRLFSIQLLHISLCLLLIIVLPACGGGGGGGGGADSNNSKINRTDSLNIEVNSVRKSFTVTKSNETRSYGSANCEVMESVNYGILTNPDTSNSCFFNYDPNRNYLGSDRLLVRWTSQSSSNSSLKSEEIIEYDIRIGYFSTDLEQLIADGLIEVTTIDTDIVYVGNYSKRHNVALGSHDFNGDGWDDLVIRSQTSRLSNIDVSVIYGQETIPKNIDLTSSSGVIDSSLGFTFSLPFNESVIKTIGDYNNDGLEDFVVNNSTERMVVYGNPNPIDPANSVIINNDTTVGVFQDEFLPYTPFFNASGHGVGDINGDGFNDFIIGTFRDGTPSAGQYENIFISTGSSLPTYIPDFGQLEQLITINMKRYDPEVRGFGRVQYGSGDVNGDGIDDLATSAYLYEENDGTPGRGYIIYGSNSFESVKELPAFSESFSGGMVITQEPETTGNYLGQCIAIIDDINGDDIDEIAISSRIGHSVSNDFLYIILGQSGLPETFRVEDIDPRYSPESSYGFKISGQDVCNARSIGDINGDGYSDFAVFDRHTDYTSPSRLYIVYGGSTNQSIKITNAPNRLFTVINQYNIMDVSAAGDVDADGYDDFLISTTTSNESARTYLVKGNKIFSSSN